MASAKRFNIAKPEEYQSEGETKTKWNTVGKYIEITKEDGSISRIVEIPAIGLKANAFPERDPREQQQSAPQQPTPQQSAPQQTAERTSSPDEQISPEDIPF